MVFLVVFGYFGTQRICIWNWFHWMTKLLMFWFTLHLSSRGFYLLYMPHRILCFNRICGIIWGILVQWLICLGY